MSRSKNMKKKAKAQKRARQKLDTERKWEMARKKWQESQRASGMPADVYALHRALGGV